MASSGSFLTSGSTGLQLRFSWEVVKQSIENNTTTISWKLTGYRADGNNYNYVTCGGFKVKINGEVVLTKSTEYRVDVLNNTVVGSGTAVIPHNADGTKTFTAYAEAGIYTYAVNCSGTADFTLDTIPRASSLTVANGTLGTEQTLTINRAASTFKHRLFYKCGDVADYIAGSATGYTTATSIKWTPPIGLAHENTTGTSVSVTLTLYTYASDGTYIGTAVKTITCAIPISVKPSVTIDWEDITGAADTYGNPVQGISKLEITLTEKTSYSSPITFRSITANGVTQNTNPATTGVLKAAGSQKIGAAIMDKRGRTGSNSAQLTVLAYTAPVISKLTVHRCDPDGTENDQGDAIRVQFSAAITPLGNKNGKAYKLRYKASTATGYTEVDLPDLGYTVTDYGYIIEEADGSSSYDVEVVATDNHGTATRATSASTAFTLMNWHPGGKGMGVGCVSQKEGTMEVELAAEFRGPLSQLGNRYTAFVPEANANGGSAGYDLMARITVKAIYASYPLTFVFGRRYAKMPMTVHVALNNTEDVAPSLKSIYFEGEDYGAYVVQSSPSVWDLYVARQNWDLVTLNTWHTCQAMDSRVELDFPCEFAASLPAGAVKATAAAARSILDYIYPVGSIHLRYDTQNPADLFGGTWIQITARVLRAVNAGGTIGTEGTIADGSGRTYIDIAVWRRTA